MASISFALHQFSDLLSLSLTGNQEHTFVNSVTLSRHAEQLSFSCLCSKVTLTISHSLTLDMLNNFCFQIYAQKSLFYR